MIELMTLEEVANYLRVTEKTVYRLLDRNGIPATKVGYQWRFDQEAIDNWLRQNSTVTGAQILVIDDDDSICSLFQDTLEDMGHKVTAINDPNEGLRLINRYNYDLVFLDLKMPRMDGAQLFKKIRTARPETPVVVVTGYPDSDLMMRALSYGPMGVMKKPFNASDVVTIVTNYLHLNISTK